MKDNKISGIAVAAAVATALIIAQYASASVSGPAWAQLSSFSSDSKNGNSAELSLTTN